MIKGVFTLNQEQRELIESIIVKNPAYRGNEHLMEQFCAEVYKKSYLLLDSVSNIDSLRNYLTKVVDTSVSAIVKNASVVPVYDKKLQKNEQDIAKYVDINPQNAFSSIKSDGKDKLENIKKQEPIVSNNKFKLKNPYEGLIDPLELVAEKPPSLKLSVNIIEVVKKIHAKDPNKKYMNIFTMRYVQNLNQSVIAQNLKLSQADLSRRFCEMVKLVREQIL